MKLYLARVTDDQGGENSVWVFSTAKKRAAFILRQTITYGDHLKIDKHTCDFPATKEGIVAFFNRHAWHEQ